MEEGETSPSSPRPLPRRRSGVVGIFWDIENCSVPHGKSAGAVAEKIRALQQVEQRREMEFVVVCDVTKEQEEVVNDLNAVQVSALACSRERPVPNLRIPFL